MYEALKQLNEEKDGLFEKFKREGREAVHSACKELFDKYPDVAGIKWTQYAPHFNDGEPCIFSVHEPEIALFSEQGLEEDDDEPTPDDTITEFEFRDWYDRKKLGGELHRDYQALSELIYNNDELMEVIFGPDCEVVVTRESVYVDEDIYHD